MKQKPNKIRIKNGYKYVPCEMCNLDWNVHIQFEGWYICPWCKFKLKKLKRGEKDAEKCSN